jgi:protocatechuate 3,4-dioxygenase beta subunit
MADGQPFKGAYVSVFSSAPPSDDSATALTGDDGLAVVAGLHGGDYLVTCEQSGFQRVEPRNVKVPPMGKAELTIALERGVEIKGRVIDEQGRPVVSADVRTLPEDPKTSDGREIVSTFTDDSGEFALEGLKPGHLYGLSASSEDRALKAPVKVKAPQTGLTLKVEMLPGVRGRVLDETGQPLKAFRVDGRELESPDGRFVVGREKDEEGKLYLTIDADGYDATTIDREYTNDVGDVKLSESPLVVGTVVDPSGQPVSGADVTCDQCIDSVVSGADGRFSLVSSGGEGDPNVIASKLNQRGQKLAPRGRPVTVLLQPPVRVEGVVKDPGGRPLQARIVVREINGGDEERVDSGPDGRFTLDLPEGLWMFITRLSSTGQTVRVTPPRTFVTLGAPPGTCAVTITVAEAVGDAWLVPGEPDRVPLQSLDDDALYAGAVALDLPLPNRPTRSAGLNCGVYTLVTTDSSGVRRERVDVRAQESIFALGPAPPAPPPSATDNDSDDTAHAQAPSVPGQP